MSQGNLDEVVYQVLRIYPSISHTRKIVSLGNRGGFSGARLWRIEQGGGPLCLKAWPPTERDESHLAWVHSLMMLARSSGLAFVPAVFTNEQGITWVDHA